MNKLQCVVAVIGMSAGMAVAAPGGWLAVGVGQTDVDFSANELDDGSFIAMSEDNGSTAFRVTGGMDFNDNFGIEIAWFDAGEIVAFDAVSDGRYFPDGYPAGPVSASVDASGLSFGVNGYLPFKDRFRAVGHLGILVWSADVTATVSGFTASASQDGNDLYLGLGAEADLSPKVGLGLNFTRYDLDGDDLDLLELVLRYRFGG